MNNTKTSAFDINYVNTILSSFDKTQTELEEKFYYTMIEHGLHKAVADRVASMTTEEFEALTTSDIETLVNEENGNYDTFKKWCYSVRTEQDSRSFNDIMKSVLKSSAEEYIDLVNNRAQISSAVNNANEVLRKFSERVSSAEYMEAKKEFIDTMKKKIDQNPDSEASKHMKEKLNVYERSQTFDFLLERINKYGDKELLSITEGFFDKDKGNYIMNRFWTSMRKLGFNPRIYRSYFNLDETLLSDYYHPMNNFFLFLIIRYIAYVDLDRDNERLFATSILGALSHINLGSASEIEIRSIKRCMTEFYDTILNSTYKRLKYIDLEYFKTNNTTYKEHPVRIEYDRAVHEEKMKKITETLKFETGDEETKYENPEETLNNILQEKAKLISLLENHPRFTSGMRYKDLRDLTLEDIPTVTSGYIERVDKPVESHNEPQTESETEE